MRSRPIPGQAKMVSVMTAPASKVTNCSETMVTSVGRMYFRQCLKMITRPGAPLSTAVLTKSAPRVSSMVERVIREITAVEYQPSVTAGNTSDSGPDRPDDGNSPRSTEKTMISIMPTQNVGAAMPDSANNSKNLSQKLPGRTADRMPVPTPSTTARTMAATASSRVAGNRSHTRSSTGMLNL